MKKKHARFEIVGASGGDMLCEDLCRGFSDPREAAVEMARGLRTGLDCSAEWALAESLKVGSSNLVTDSDTNPMDVLANYLTTRSIDEQRRTVKAFAPRLGQDGPSPDEPRLDPSIAPHRPAPQLNTWR